MRLRARRTERTDNSAGWIVFDLHRMVMLLATLPLFSVSLAAQPDNLSQLRNCARTLSDSVIAVYSPADSICLSVISHDGSWLLEEEMIVAASVRGIRLQNCTETSPRSLTAAISRIEVRYEETESDDLYERVSNLEFSASLPEVVQGGIGRSARSFAIELRDTIGSDNTSLLERSGYEFARGIPPPQPRGGFWKKVVEPAVVIGASVVMIILFFTVRSQ